MKLGICYNLFDGEEFLPFTLKAIRNQADFVSIIYQTKSYFGTSADPAQKDLVEDLKSQGLIDKLVHFDSDLKLEPRTNETAIRNLGLQISRDAGCTHHISADVDELYEPEQFAYVKKESEVYDCTVVLNHVYYKHPTWRLDPPRQHWISLIHTVDNAYDRYIKFPYPIDVTRRLVKHDKLRVFEWDEFFIHHMSFVRKDISKKFKNSSMGLMPDFEQFMKIYDTYQLGGRLRLPPDYRNRNTILVDNKFDIHL